MSCQWSYVLKGPSYCFEDAHSLRCAWIPNLWAHSTIAGRGVRRGPDKAVTLCFMEHVQRSVATALQTLTQTHACRSTEAPQAGD